MINKTFQEQIAEGPLGLEPLTTDEQIARINRIGPETIRAISAEGLATYRIAHCLNVDYEMVESVLKRE